MDAAQGVAPSREVVVRLNLRRQWGPREAQLPLHKGLAKGRPIHLRIGHPMGVELPGGAAKLGRIHGVGKPDALAAQALHEHLKLFPQRHGRRRLSMRPRQHRHILPFQGQARQVRNHLVQQRQNHAFRRAFQRQRNRSVVDVLGSQPKVDELLPRPHTQLVHRVFHEVFDRLHIVVGDAFLVLHPLGVLS